MFISDNICAVCLELSVNIPSNVQWKIVYCLKNYYDIWRFMALLDDNDLTKQASILLKTAAALWCCDDAMAINFIMVF